MQAVAGTADERAALARGVRTILLASVLFGMMAVSVRVAARSMPAAQIAFVRFTGSLLVLLALGHGRSLRPRGGTLGRVVLRGLLGAGAILLYYVGIARAGAGLATLLTNTYPVFTALFSTVLLRERFDARLGWALLLNTLGVAIVLGPGIGVRSDVLIGGMTALGAAMLSGAALTTARQLRRTESAFLITTYFMAVGATVTAPSVALGLPALSAPLGGVLAVVVLTSVAGQVLLHQGLGFAPAIEGSLAAATSVLTAALLEATLLGEHLGVGSLTGGALLVAAVGLALRRPSRAG